MRNVILFDPVEARENLLPLTYTRPVALLRHGIMTIAEKWKHAIEGNYSFETQDYLTEKYPLVLDTDDNNLFIAGNIEPDDALVKAVIALNPGESLTHKGVIIAARGPRDLCRQTEWANDVLTVNEVYDLFMTNDEALRRDYRILTAGRKSQPLSDSCRLIGAPTLPDGTPALFIEKGATVEGAIINVKNGPVYIGRDAEIMEGSCLRGPVALCEHAVVNMGSKIYGATTLGPYCKAGGELNNVIMTGYSNKSHDGFLGNAVIGEWCNLGAGCTASNLKNDYSPIRLWSFAAQSFKRTGLQFCGLIMGDHSKAGINTMFNTATVVGVGVNFYGAGFPRTFLPSFTEGSTAGMKPVDLDRFYATASRMMARRHVELTPIDKEIYYQIKLTCAD